MEINESNFDQYFFDVRKHKPKPGQVLACFTAMADLISEREKENLVDLLIRTGKMQAVVQIMRKLFHASELDAILVPKRILEDLISGMSREEVIEKAYRFQAELYFYTLREHVPDNPHWTIFDIVLSPSSYR